MKNETNYANKIIIIFRFCTGDFYREKFKNIQLYKMQTNTDIITVHSDEYAAAMDPRCPV